MTKRAASVSPRTQMLRHGKIELALHHLREDASGGRPLLLLQGLGEMSRVAVPQWVEAWPGPIVALDFTGHGKSTIPRGGGYTAELLLADADAALASLLEDGAHTAITVAGRGLGAYIALQLAGARAPQVHGAILLDGPGLAGGATQPTSQSFFRLPVSDSVPDPYALVELGTDLRPPDYAASFVRLALAGSGLDEPIAVCGIIRPKWLSAVVQEHGVVETSIAEALDIFSS